MQSSTAAAAMHRALGIVAVHLCWVAVVLYAAQKTQGVIAVTSKAVSTCLTEQHRYNKHAQGPGHCSCASVLAAAELYETQNSQVICSDSKAVSTCNAEQHCAAAMHRALGIVACSVLLL
jgi:hypothetical protein